MHVRGDGTVDIQLLGEKKSYVSRVPIRLLTPVKEFTATMDTILAKKKTSEANSQPRHAKWSRVELQILSLSEMRIPEGANAAIIVTILSHPEEAEFSHNELGEIVDPSGLPKVAGAVNGKKKLNINNTAKLWTYVVPTASGASIASKAPVVLENNLLDAAAAFIIRIVDQGKDAEPTMNKVLGMAKFDIQTLDQNEPNKHLKVFPDKGMKFDTFYGVVHARTQCTPRPVDDDVIENQGNTDGQITECKKGLHEWYLDVLRKENETPLISLRNLLDPGNHVELSYIARRQALRGALSARQNRQVDNLGYALNTVYRHLLGVLRELELFDEYESLSHDDQRKFSAVHTVSANPDSEWLYRRINDLTVHVRKNIVVELEMQLLSLAGCKAKDLPPIPAQDATLEQWLEARATRYAILNPMGDFLPKERGFLLKYSACFTGSGIVSWILRMPNVLWKDTWVEFAPNESIESDSKLGWDDPELLNNTEAIQAPEGREHTLVWLKALFDAGFIESVSDKRDFADKEDRYYRLHGLEHERLHQRLKDSTFPLDLVREVDCQTKSIGELFCKRLTDHAAGFLGAKSHVSTLIGTAHTTVETLTNMKVPHLTLPNVSASLNLPSDLLWDWKYCIFVPGSKHDRKYIYMYDSVHATNASVVIDLSGTQTIVTYSNANLVGTDCFEIRNPVFLTPHAETNKLMKMTEAEIDDAFKCDVTQQIVLKAQDSQVWMQAMLLAGVKVTLEKKQKVLFQRLNSSVLQAKCIKQNVPFTSHDPEGSFQHLMNAIFGHDKATKQSSDKKVKQLRSRLRNELKKAGHEKEPVTAKYGRSGVFDPPPTDARKFTKGHEYAARICSVKTPFTETLYPYKQLYKIDKAPPRMVELLKKYKVASRMAWLELPKNIRDIFLLYDVEYHHKSEIIIEKDLLREDFHTMDGDLDPLKVHDKCLDLNVIFKPHDLEGCVSLFTEYANGETPMGCFRIQLQALSDQRELDWWFKLTPERGMIQRRDLGSIRVRIEMRKHEKTTQLGSLALPPPVAQVVERTALAFSHKPHEDSWFNKRKKSAANTTSKPKAPVRSILHIDILEGRKLIVADIKTSDPFVQVYLVGTKNGRDEEIACGKTDIIPNTLNPKWKNQGFTLGKSEETRLDDKKALILRVFDHDSLSSNDPMGCVKLEFEKDALGYIRRLKLHHSGPNGKEIPTWIALNENGFAEVYERLMRDTKAGQMAWAKARGNTEEDGVLGRLRFRINLTHNDFNDTPHDTIALGNGSPVKPSQLQLAAGPTALTRYGLEITLNSVFHEDKTKKSKEYNPEFASLLEALSWAFVPKTKDGHCVSYDLNAEQMTHNSKKAILEHKGEVLVLGSTYDITRVATYDIVLTNTDKGCCFVGSLAVRTDLAETTIDIECFNNDSKDKFKKIFVTISASFIGLNRASYVQRVLTETYLYSGLEFDSKNIHTLGETAEDFLWETCHAAVCPGQNVSELLFDQLYKLSLSTRLHWERTPKLLFFILHHSMSNGKDRLPYRHTLPLDNVLQRWSAILSFIAEARAQLTGRLHGEFTPRLIANLATLCDWSGEKDNTVTTIVRDVPRVMQALHVGECVQARVSNRSTILPGSLVDVLLGGKYFAGRVAQLWSDGYADIVFASDIGTATPLKAEELPPIAVDAIAFVLGEGSPSQLWENYRRATVTEIKDGKEFRIVFDKSTDEALLPREQLVLRENRISLDHVHSVLAASDFVRVVQDQTSRTARIVLAKGNATYDVQFYDSIGESVANIPRDDIIPAPTAVVNGVITTVSKSENEEVAPLYDILLQNATTVNGVSRNSIRLEGEHLCTEQLYVCSTYLNDLGVGPDKTAVESLRKLWRDTSVIQAYLDLPKPISSVAVRDSLYGATNLLTPRNNTAPQFLGQYHGYVLGPQWSDLDKAKVANIRGLKQKDLPLKNLLSIIVAPIPFVHISGMLILQGNEHLGFKAALEQWKSMLLSTEMQRLIASWAREAVPFKTDPMPVTIASISSHLNGKPVKDVKLDEKGMLQVSYMSTGKTLKDVSPDNLQLHVNFQIKVPLSASSTLSDALTLALDKSKAICEALHMHSLIALTSQPKALWSSDSDTLMEVATEMAVRLQVTSTQLKDAPTAEIAIEPLHDIRLVVTAEDKSEHEVVLSIQHLQNECGLRHELLPRFAATVVERKDSDKTCIVRFNDAKEGTSIVSLSDVHLDTLNNEVLKANDLHTTISNRKGSIGDYLDEDIQWGQK
ncbi:hypothetical protein THRCLA_07908 [Thraustotheca clavata]|uniref:C2 domain-containing protein n=1 Tax=Thraustotheca clavata TaxID=74557 RepID=A0A1V9ZBL9_9STRA|nr:hypothetical protein THRCLA_07908 [Thraustotheca clavata]